jgi:hypothetical protein
MFCIPIMDITIHTLGDIRGLRISVVGTNGLSFPALAFAFLEAGVGVAVEGGDWGDVIWIVGDVGHCPEGAFDEFSDSGAAGFVVYSSGRMGLKLRWGSREGWMTI